MPAGMRLSFSKCRIIVLSPTSPTEDIDDIYCVMVNLILNTGLSLVSKKAIKAKIKEFQ